ncbi:MAG: hypothetical protein U5P41_00770 [Gammaproteobacteria bacterium]|nr:hypothetical protein [Gammaproteobacteria bacterium]
MLVIFHFTGVATHQDRIIRNPFNSDISLAWNNITDAEIEIILDQACNGVEEPCFELLSPAIACAVNSECLDPDDPFNGDVPDINDVTNASCVWSSKVVFECSGQFLVPDGGGSKAVIAFSSVHDIYGYKYGLNTSAPGLDYIYTDTSGSWQWEIAYIDDIGTGYNDWPVIPLLDGNISRIYEFTIKYQATSFDDSNIIDADSGKLRTRNLSIDSENLAEDDVYINVTDNMTDITYYPGSDKSPDEQEAEIIVTSQPETTGTIAATGLQYDLDIDDGELPDWFVINKWHEMAYVAYAESEDFPGDNASSCSSTDDNCLVLNWIGPNNVEPDSVQDIRALALLAGRELNNPPLIEQDRESNAGNPESYFEDNNSSIDDRDFAYGIIDDGFNDRARLILRVEN